MSSFPFIEQRDTMQCGVACLAMLCRYYGKNISLHKLENICHATTEGISMLGIKEAAEKLGFKTIIAKASVAKLLDLDLPCILHWNQNHFVVLFRISSNGQRFHIADPAKGMTAYDSEEFAKHWISSKKTDQTTGIVAILSPNETFDYVFPSANDNGTGRALRFLFGYMKLHRCAFMYVFLGLLIGCVLQMLMPFLTQAIVDTGIHNRDIGFIWLVLFGELMIVVGRTVTDFIRHRLLLKISMKVNISLVSDFIIKLLKLPMAFFDTKLTGDLIQRIGDHSRVQDFLTGQTLSIVFSLLTLLVFGAVLLFYNPLLFLIFATGSAIYGLWITLFLKKRKALDYEMFECQAANQNCTYQLVTSMQEIKLQRCGGRRCTEWKENKDKLFAVQFKRLKLQQTQEAGAIFIHEIKNILITVLAAASVIEGSMTLGEMLAVQYIIGQLNSPIAQLMSFIYALQDVRISLERINEIHDRKGEDDKESLHKGFLSEKSIHLNNVCFRYDPHSPRKTLDGISMEAPAGQVTAIVGASGSGKTTLLKLMLGFYPIESGILEIAGRDIDHLEHDWWRSRCGAVMQDGVIFSESIERNIAVEEAPVDQFRLVEAAKIANIHEYIRRLPLGFATKIGRDGIGLSQGQKQRILIARAVYKNPDFIFLDEATNSLDAENERAIVENLSEFYRGRTVVVVAHRLSTVKNADRIIVLDSGKVVETGNHESLIARKGIYFNLIRNQLELGK